MADGSGLSPLRRDVADQVLLASLICIATSRTDHPDQELAIHLVSRALPSISNAPRIEALRDVAVEIVAAWPHRRKRGEGVLIWLRAHLDLSAAVARDAIRSARSKMEAV